MQQANSAHHNCCNYGRADKRVRNAAMMLQLFNGTCESPEDINVRGFRGQNSSNRRISRLAVETRPADARPG